MKELGPDLFPALDNSIPIRDSSLAERIFPIEDRYPRADFEAGLAKDQAMAADSC